MTLTDRQQSALFELSQAAYDLGKARQTKEELDALLANVPASISREDRAACNEAQQEAKAAEWLATQNTEATA